MKKKFMNELINGDNIEIMKSMDENYVDLIILLNSRDFSREMKAINNY